MTHSHQCHLCKVTYNCEEKRCKAEHAAKVNKRGPYCTLCRHTMMFLRYAGARGFDPLTFIRVVQSHERELAK